MGKPPNVSDRTARLDHRQFDLLSISVAAVVAAHLEHLPVWLWLPAAILIPLRLWTRRNGGAVIGLWSRLPPTILLVILVVVSYGNLFGREPGSVLGCGLLALKLLEAERVRDARVALGFAAFVLMSALLFTQTLIFTALVCVVLVLLIGSLAALQPAPAAAPASWRAPFKLALLLLAAGLPLAAAAFVLVPRLGSPLWGAPGNDSLARTGLGERMSPGDLTELLIDDSPALRVDFEGPVPPPALRYFRAIVLSDFDGRAWTRERVRPVLHPAEVRSEGPLIGYTVTLEPTDRRWLPALDLPINVPDAALLGADRSLMATENVSQPRRYRVESATHYTLAPTLTAAERARALALPVGFDPRTRALASQWRTQAAGDDDVVRAALDLFHARFTYTLSVPLLGRDSIDDFLFDTQRGFCEHYSSAFVFLMRAAGIPSRVVTGYQGGWWNEASAYLLVRQSDAHAWAEVWMPGRGWQRVDPTAAVSPHRIELGAAAVNERSDWTRGDWLLGVRNRFDIANRLWTESIIRFDALRQKGMLSPFGMPDANQGDLLLALSAVLGAAMLLATVWAMRGGRRATGDALDRVWSTLMRRFARAGLEARASEAPFDWLERVRGKSPELGRRLAPLVEDYVALRYGGDVPEAARLRAFANSARRLRVSRHVKT